MSDRLVRGLFQDRGLRAVFVRVTETARIARMLHGLYPTSARLFAEALAAGLLTAALQKDGSRVNLQLACDGPLRGLLVDAGQDGSVRGYVRSPQVDFPASAPEAGDRAALGGEGYLSVLRDQGNGQYHRSQIELEALTLAGDLRRFYEKSEQVESALDVRVIPAEGQPIGDAAGVLVQKLPGGDQAALEQVRARIAEGAFLGAVKAGATAQEAIAAVAGPGFELLGDLEVAYRCSCGPDRARVAVSALGRDGILDVLANEKQAVITCEFCRQTYVVAEPELRDILGRLSQDA
ncbi:Hsp33 family molecular chaperone HslO [Anaeromyxobacter paludicola]|uniref:33 kDa chaperonin n=1 Tax=Anaeromyxobacter paludicola TaxID=2918171 RepID=A0ABM7XE76_9BACT|nr:Hsp33 family molecular chaperone HslO [Anaeromyxobacter paludicola]BDG10168.1 33 kDa chaperonin [Anaeromyxobacter paludicola]